MVCSNFSFASGPSLYLADIVDTPQFSDLLKKLIGAIERVGHYLEILRQDFNRTTTPLTPITKETNIRGMLSHSGSTQFLPSTISPKEIIN